MIRISELQGMDLSREPDTKALPERPVSDDGSCGDLPHSFAGGSSRFSGGSTSPPTSRSRHEPLILEEGGRLAPGQIPPRRQSLLPSPLDDELRFMTAPPSSKGFPDHGWYGLPSQASRSEHLQTARCDVDGILRPTLFPARPRSPEVSNMEPNSPHGPQYRKASLLSTAAGDASESTSWLDTIDESGPSSPTSAHSQASSLYLRHRKSSLGSQGTEAEFDAALDAAVEAAYDEGLEPAIELAGNESDDDDVVANARRNVELAKQKVREAEREAAEAMIRGRPGMIEHTNHVCPDYLDEESEEEERLLEEMTRGYVMDDFEFGLQSKSALPRQFGSSGVSGKTWENSTISNTETGGASLPTLVEDDALSTVGASLNSPTPLSADEILPSASMASPNVDIPPQQPLSRPAPGVRARRLSGQNPKDLKIQTNNHWRTDSEVSGPDQASSLFDSPLPPIPKDESQTSYKSTVPAPAMRHGVGKDTRNSSMGSLAEGSITDGGLRKVLTEESDYGNANTPSTVHPMGKVPSAPDNLGQRNVNQNALRARNVSVPTSDPTTVDSPHTPAGSAFPVLDFHKGPASGGIPIPPTPTATTFAPDGLLSGGLSLFDNHIHSPTNPGTPNPAATNAPNPLEPCPESFLLRPFWLMRCMYESIAHPSGAYLSTKLFIPRDMWCVKNVKLKAVEEKVSSCDLLTAALLKLAQVDTFDADAVLEEMQSLEVVLDQVQASLSKKLGNDVGVQGAMSLFKLFPSSDDAASASDAPPRVSNGPSKSYLTSWRKLRSKNSGTGATTPLSSSKEPSKDNLTINSLPMTSTPSSQSVKRNVMQLQLNGPNANYMGALARLCDAAQVLGKLPRFPPPRIRSVNGCLQNTSRPNCTAG